MHDDGHYGDPPRREETRHLRRAIRIVLVSLVAGLAAIAAIFLTGGAR